MNPLQHPGVDLYARIDTIPKTRSLYTQNTSSGRDATIYDWIDRSLDSLDYSAKTLEIDSASGYDAKIIEDKGFVSKRQTQLKVLCQNSKSMIHLRACLI